MPILLNWLWQGSALTASPAAVSARAAEPATAQTRHAPSAPVAEAPAASTEIPRRAETTGTTPLDTASSEPLPVDPLPVVALFTPGSKSTAPASPDPAMAGASTSTRAHAPPEAPMPWTRAADAATAIGRGSREGAIKTAGVFTRIGKSVAGAF
jgi:hypothetical protein